MHLLVLSLSFEYAGREALALSRVLRQDAATPDDVCVIARGLHGDVQLRRSHELAPGRAAAWLALGRRVAELRDRRVVEEPAAPIAKVLRRGTSSILVLAGTMEVFEQVYELARTVGCAIVLVSLPREGELPVIGRSPPDRVAERRS